MYSQKTQQDIKHWNQDYVTKLENEVPTMSRLVVYKYRKISRKDDELNPV